VKLPQSGIILNFPDGFLQTAGHLIKADFKDLNNSFLATFLAAFLAELLGECHSGAACLWVADDFDFIIEENNLSWGKWRSSVSAMG
jgi:hypothetical protein